MILPSEDDSRKPGDSPPPGGSDEPAGGPMPWDDGAFFDDDEEGDSIDEPSGKIQSPAPPGWRDELKQALLEAVEDLREIEDPDEDFDPPEPPDLFTFYGELAAMRHEMRRGSKRAADSLLKLTENKSGMEEARPLALALLSLFDRAAGHPEQQAAVESAMAAGGISRLKTGQGQPFDAARMITADKVRKNAAVASEIEPGFLWRDQVLRPARVSLA